MTSEKHDRKTRQPKAGKYIANCVIQIFIFPEQGLTSLSCFSGRRALRPYPAKKAGRPPETMSGKQKTCESDL